METNWNKYFFKFIEKNSDKPWDWDWLSGNPNITWEIVTMNPDKPWDWKELSKNPKITMDIVEANPDKPWSWYCLSRNPNITWDIVEANPTKNWNWEYLSENKFTKERENFELRVRYQKFVQEHLFEEFVKAYMHPKRITKLLEMGYSIDELDEIL